MHMNAEFTVEGVGSVAKHLVRLCSDGRSCSRVHQDSWSGDDLRLIGMKNRNVVKGAVERSCLLTCHQGDIRLSAALRNALKTRKRDAGQDQDRDSPETHAAGCCGARTEVDTTKWMLLIHNVVPASETANRLVIHTKLENRSAWTHRRYRHASSVLLQPKHRSHEPSSPASRTKVVDAAVLAGWC